MIKRVAVLSVMFAISLNLASQEMKSLQETFLESEYFFMYSDYSDALPGYLSILEKMPDNANVAYRIGVCYLNISGQKNHAPEYLEKAVMKVSSRHKDGTISQLTAPYDAIYQLGVAYRINYQLDKAKEAFRKYRETLLPDDNENLNFVDHEISSCDNAKKLMENPVDFTVENMGPLFNDEKDNFNPVISGDGKSFVFMTSMKFYDAVMYTRLADGKWTAPENIIPDLQVDGSIFVSCLSFDGKTLLLSQGDNYNSDILVSTFNGSKWSKAVRLNKNINTKYWESHGFLSEDGNTLVFASDRPGGFGGLDIYISKKENGDWGPAVNIGPEINTALNEDRPFLINNSKILFFASQDHESMGGYDIFRSDRQPNGLWGKPKNLGYPINTTDDNILLMPVANGKSGYISIYREGEGFGRQDIYKITVK
ncbi:MAG TPA: hypothetical protein VMT63_03280 [Bacteroidales bacterium]|nr:hypothetical protein [Bacteroidales bacterium]